MVKAESSAHKAHQALTQQTPILVSLEGLFSELITGPTQSIDAQFCRIELDGTFWNSTPEATKLQCMEVVRTHPFAPVLFSPAEWLWAYPLCGRLSMRGDLGMSSHKPNSEHSPETPYPAGGSLQVLWLTAVPLGQVT